MIPAITHRMDTITQSVLADVNVLVLRLCVTQRLFCLLLNRFEVIFLLVEKQKKQKSSETAKSGPNNRTGPKPARGVIRSFAHGPHERRPDNE
jgi:hypothetical protein